MGWLALWQKEKVFQEKPLPLDASRPQSEEMQAHQEQVQHLQFEVAVLKENLVV